MQCIVHIGLMKTGSTSIQEFFHSNKQRFRQLGVNYMDTKASNHSWAIMSAYRGGGESDSGTDSVAPARQQILDAMRENSSPWFIISGEGIPRLNQAEMELFFKDVSAYFSKITVVVYLREIVSFAESVINESVKKIRTTLRQELEQLEKAPTTFIPYRRQIEAVLQHVDKRHLVCRVFDSETLAGGDVVLDFIQAAGLPEELCRYYARQPFNRSTSHMAMLVYSRIFELLQRVQVVEPPSLELSAETRILLDLFRSSKFRLPHRLTSRIYQAMNEDLRWLNSNFGVTFKKRDDQTETDRDELLKTNVYATLLAKALVQYLFTDDIPAGTFAKTVESLYRKHSGCETPPPELFLSLARIFRHKNDESQARAVLQQIAGTPPDEEVSLRVARQPQSGPTPPRMENGRATRPPSHSHTRTTCGQGTQPPASDIRN